MFAFLDNTTNFAKSTIANAGGINSAVTSVTVATGDGAKFPSSNFNVVLWDVATYADPADDAGREIVRCTSRSSDVLTITRAQEGTTASSHAQNAGVMLALTDKMRDDIEAYLQGRLGSDIASASTTDIGTSTGQGVTITGTTTITALGTADAGTYRRVTFSGALTLTHNATSLILPGSANITTSAGDVAYFVSLGSGNWKCEAYNKKNGQAVASGGADISARAYQTSNTFIDAATWKSAALQAENFDTDNIHDISTNNSRLTIKTSGKYAVQGNIFMTNATVASARLYVNGATVIAESKDSNTTASPYECGFSLATIYEFSVNDYIEIQGYLGSGGSTSGDGRTNLSINKIA